MSSDALGLSSIGIYLPRARLDRSLIAQAWGGRPAKGARAVAGYDEDALTMGVEAAHRCLEAVDPLSIGGLFFASTSSPYREKQISSVVATACDLPREILTADFGGSVRSGVAALSAALRAVASGAADRVLVVASDCRPTEPESELEGVLGDGAAAVVVDREARLARFEEAAHVAEEFTFQWRREGSAGVQVQEQRFAVSHGYLRDLGEVIGRVLNEGGVGTDELDWLAVGAPDAKTAGQLARAVGVPAESVLAPGLIQEPGVLGSPDPLVQLGVALEQARPGAAIVAAAYAEGAEALLFRAGEGAGPGACRPPLEEARARRLPLPSYERYLKYRRLLGRDDTPVEAVSSILEARELQQDVRLYGSRCRKCGLVQYPQARVCIGCQAQEELDPVKLAKRGAIFTYTVDHLAANLERPLGMAVVDLEGGGRLYLQMTDCSPEEVRIGAPVQLTFRRLHSGGDNYNYFWKARPI